MAQEINLPGDLDQDENEDTESSSDSDDDMKVCQQNCHLFSVQHSKTHRSPSR